MYSKRGKKIVASTVATALVFGMSLSTAPALAATIHAPGQAVVLAAQQQDNATTEKTLSQAVWDKADLARMNFEPAQLLELAQSLQNLTDWLWDTGTVTDKTLVGNCIYHAKEQLDWGTEQDFQDADILSAANTARVSHDNAKAALVKVTSDMYHQSLSGMTLIGGGEAPSGTAVSSAAPVNSPITNSESLFTAPTAYTTSTAIFAANGSFLLAAGTAQANDMSNFKPVVSYPNFTDVPTTQWFYAPIKLASEYGLVKGTSATTFNPQGNVSIQEAIIMAARVRCIYEWGSNTVHYPNNTPVGNAASWATPEINYAIANGLIGSKDFTDYTKLATRAEMAHIFANVLPVSTKMYDVTNTIDDGAIPDVNSSTKYGSDIYKLYRAGVLNGSGDDHLATPTANITRAETAAIVSRLPLPTQRKDFDMINPGSNDSTTSNTLANGQKAPYAGHTIYVGTATQTTAGQPRSTTQSGSATSRVATRYGFHNYNSNNQSEYDAVVQKMQEIYNNTVAKGNSALTGCGLDSEGWAVVDAIIAGRSYDADAWNAYLKENFSAIATNIKDAKTQAQTLKLYAQFRTLYLASSPHPGTTGISAYDSMFRGKGSCVSTTQHQMLAADMLGIDCASYVSGKDEHMFSILKINGVYINGESGTTYTSLDAARGVFTMLTEWTSASAPTK